MDWTTIITSFIGSLGLSGGIMGLFYLKENKRAKQLANDATAAQQWKELYEKAEAKNETLETKIDNLHRENNQLRDTNNTLTTQNAVLEMQKCEVNGCTTRRPPRGF